MKPAEFRRGPDVPAEADSASDRERETRKRRPKPSKRTISEKRIGKGDPSHYDLANQKVHQGPPVNDFLGTTIRTASDAHKANNAGKGARGLASPLTNRITEKIGHPACQPHLVHPIRPATSGKISRVYRFPKIPAKLFSLTNLEGLFLIRVEIGQIEVC